MNASSSPLEKLANVLALEQNLGYTDKAVIGGLGKFIAHWRDEVQLAKVDPAQVRLVEDTCALLEAYADASIDRRQEIIEEVLSAWKDVEGEPPAVEQESTEPTPPPPAKISPASGRTDLSSPARELHGVSDTYAKRLERLGINTIQDLLYLFPSRYDDFSALKTIDKLDYGEEVTIIGTVRETKERTSKKGQSIVTSTISDGTATVQATWFNQPYLTRRLRQGKQIVISGKVDQYMGRPTFVSPTWEPLDEELIHTKRLVPVYPLTRGVTARFNLNLLSRINRQLGGEFDLDLFVHRALYNERRHRIEMYLISKCKQEVHIDALDRSYHFDKGERIHTENSHKFSKETIETLARDAGMKIVEQWLDERKYFCLTLLRTDQE